MTIIEAAAQLGLSPTTLRLQAQANVLRATKRGRDYWVTQKAVDDYRRLHLGRHGAQDRTGQDNLTDDT